MVVLIGSTSCPHPHCLLQIWMGSKLAVNYHCGSTSEVISSPSCLASPSAAQFISQYLKSVSFPESGPGDCLHYASTPTLLRVNSHLFQVQARLSSGSLIQADLSLFLHPSFPAASQCRQCCLLRSCQCSFLPLVSPKRF